MRRIVKLKLSNENIIYVVANAKSDSEVRKMAIENSTRLIRDKALVIDKNCTVLSGEEWDSDRKYNNWKVSRKYITAFYMNKITQNVTVDARSPKHAYNRVKEMFGIQNDMFMIIFDTEHNRRKSATKEAVAIAGNEKEINNLLSTISEKLNSEQYYIYRDATSRVVRLLIAILNNKYDCGNTNLRTIIISFLLYFAYTEDYELDINSNTSKLNDKQALEILINNTRNDVNKLFHSSITFR